MGRPATIRGKRPEPHPHTRPDVQAAPIADLRFRRLLPAADWAALPEAVRQRFSHRLEGGATIVYAGRVTAMRRNLAGTLLAHALRLLGAPLPLAMDVDVPSVISVTEDVATGGQNWTRMYANRTAFPQIIHSAKRFEGPTGLEEYIGSGIAMSLRVGVESGALVFRDAGYHVTLFGHRVPVPRFLQPGRLEVRHEDRGGGRFRFALTVRHPWLGEVLHQAGEYRDFDEAAA